MRFLFFSDLHLHNFSQFSTRLPSGRNSRLQDGVNVVIQAAAVAIEKSVDAIFFVGDWHHSRTKIDVDVWYASYQAMRQLAATNIPVYVLMGNHDLAARSGEVHSLEAFKPFVTVVDKPMVRQLSKAGEPSVQVVMFPYTADVETLKRQFAALPQVDLLLFHQGVREAAVGPYGATVHAEISLNDFPLDRIRHAVGGDYHLSQSLANGKVHYCGSPLQLNFGEAGCDKRFIYIDTSDWKIQSIPTSAPRFHNFENPNEYVEALAAGKIRPEIDFVRVLYDDEAEIAADVKEIETRVQWHQRHMEQQALSRVGEDVVGDDRALLEAFVEQQSGSDSDKQRLLNIGMELLSGANA